MSKARSGGVFALLSFFLGCAGTADGTKSWDEAPSESVSSAETGVLPEPILLPPLMARPGHMRFCWLTAPVDARKPLVEAVIHHTLEDRSEFHVMVEGFEPCIDDRTADVGIQTDGLPLPSYSPVWTLGVDVGGIDGPIFDRAVTEASTVHAIATLFGGDLRDHLAKGVLPPLALLEGEILTMQAFLAPRARVTTEAVLTSSVRPTAAARALSPGEKLTACPAEIITLSGGLGVRTCAGASEQCVFVGPAYQPRKTTSIEIVAAAIAYSDVGFDGAAVALTSGKHVMSGARPISSLFVPPSLRATACTDRNADARSIALGIGACRRIVGGTGGVSDFSAAFTSPVRLIVVEPKATDDVDTFSPALAVPQSARQMSASPGRYLANLDAGACTDGAPITKSGAWTAYRQFRDAPSPWGDSKCLYQWSSASGAPPDVDALRHSVRAAEIVPFVELAGHVLVCAKGACAPEEATLVKSSLPSGGDKPACDVCGGQAFNSIAYITVNPSDPTMAFDLYAPGWNQHMMIPNTGAGSYVIRNGSFGTGRVYVFNQGGMSKP